MRSLRPLELVVPVFAALLGVASLVLWTNAGPRDRHDVRIPGQDRPAGAVKTVAVKDPQEGSLTRGEGAAANIPGAWPCFRGVQLDGIAHETVPLAREWPASGPPALWSVELGEGYAGPVVRDGRVYLLDYDREASADALRCLSLADGREIWCYRYPVDIKRNHGMSRTVPALSGKYIVSLGPKCHVLCLDAETGEKQWMIDLVAEYGTKIPEWYAGQCPLIEGDRVILAPAGKDVLMTAVDLKTGKPIWTAPNRRGWKMTHVSIAPMELQGRRMYVYCGSGGVAGVAADSGELLWDTTDWKISIATVPSPVPLPDGRIFLCGGYNAGAMMLRVKEEAGKFSVSQEFKLRASRFGSTQHTPLFSGGHLFGIREKDKELVCLDLQGNEVWTSGSQHRFGDGPYLIADGLIFLVDDEAVLTMAEATPAGYRQLGQFRVLEGHDAWGPMALVDGRLLVRDLTRMVCLDIRKP